MSATTTFTVAVSGEVATATALNDLYLTSGSVGTYISSFTYDEVWSDLTLEAVFISAPPAWPTNLTATKNLIRRSATLTNDSATVHADVLTVAGNKLWVGLTGLDNDGNIIKNSTLALVGTIQHGADVDGPGNGDIPETQYQEIKRLIEDFGGATDEQVAAAVADYVEENPIYSLSSFGVTATATELNYCDGVTSNIQTQIDELSSGKAPAGFGYGDKMTYYDVQDGTFEATLESILSGMVGYSAKQIQFYDSVDLIANKFIGTLWKYTDNYAVLIAVSYSGYKAIKRKQGGTWQPWEWENPPMLSGVEYRTTERSNGSVVYRKMVEYTNEDTFGEAGTMTTVQVAHGISKFGGLIRSACRHGNYYPVPAFTSAGYTLAVVEVSALNITLRTNAAWTSRTWYFDLAYTKTS